MGVEVPSQPGPASVSGATVEASDSTAADRRCFSGRSIAGARTASSTTPRAYQARTAGSDDHDQRVAIDRGAGMRVVPREQRLEAVMRMILQRALDRLHAARR